MDDGGEHAQALFMFACLAQKSGEHALAKTAWSKYVTFRREQHSLIIMRHLGEGSKGSRE